MTTPSPPTTTSNSNHENKDVKRPREEGCLLCYDPFDDDDVDDPNDDGSNAAADQDDLAVRWVGPLDQCHHAVCEGCLVQYLRHTHHHRRHRRCEGGLPPTAGTIRCPSIGHATDDCGTYLSDAILERYAPPLPLDRKKHSSSSSDGGGGGGGGDDTKEDRDEPGKAAGATVGHSCHSDALEVETHRRDAATSSDEDLRQLQETERVVRRVTKPCSHCGSALWKSGGCDHVACPACGNDMCYKCGTHQYLTGHVIRTCSHCRQGYVDHRHDNLYRRRLLLGLPFLLPGWMLYSLATGCLAVATGCFCCCFLCGWEGGEEEELQETQEREEYKDATAATTTAKQHHTTNDISVPALDSYSATAGSIPETHSSGAAVDTVATSPSTNNSWDSTTTESPRYSSSVSKSASFAPWKRGVRRTAVYIGLPFVTYLRDMGWDRAGVWLDDAMALGGATAAAAAGGGGGGNGGGGASASSTTATMDIPVHPIVVRNSATSPSTD